MKQNILSFLALLGVILTFSCNNTITPETIQTQKVILLYGNYSLINNNTLIELSDGANKLQIPVSALLDGKALFGDAIKNKFQGSLLFKDQGTLYAQINTFLQTAGARYSGNKLDPTGSQAITPPRTPPPCGTGQCPGLELYQVSTFEINVATPITMAATVQAAAN
jgi:hypothetical protein